MGNDNILEAAGGERVRRADNLDSIIHRHVFNLYEAPNASDAEVNCEYTLMA
jgi:hypothetical protein